MTIKRMFQTMVTKISSPVEFFSLIAAIFGCAFGIVTWANTNFVSAAEGKNLMLTSVAVKADSELAEQIKILSAEVKESNRQTAASNEMLMTHIRKYRLDSTLTLITDLEDKVFSLNQFMRANGSSPQDESRLQDLATQLKAAEFKKSCIISNLELCDT